MERIEKSIEVDVPVTTCYNQWTQFESFPSFMEGVLEVQQLDDKRLRWAAEVAGDRKEWTAEIVEQRPDEVISWRSTSGAMNNGSVAFQEVAPNRTKVTTIMTYELVGLKEKIGDALGVLQARIEGDLRRFKEFIETQQVPTGAWRGEIREGQVRKRDEATALGTTPGGSALEAEAQRARAEKRK
jgi:uncharacterized membrane protein